MSLVLDLRRDDKFSYITQSVPPHSGQLEGIVAPPPPLKKVLWVKHFLQKSSSLLNFFILNPPFNADPAGAASGLDAINRRPTTAGFTRIVATDGFEPPTLAV